MSPHINSLPDSDTSRNYPPGKGPRTFRAPKIPHTRLGNPAPAPSSSTSLPTTNSSAWCCRYSDMTCPAFQRKCPFHQRISATNAELASSAGSGGEGFVPTGDCGPPDADVGFDPTAECARCMWRAFRPGNSRRVLGIRRRC